MKSSRTASRHGRAGWCGLLLACCAPSVCPAGSVELNGRVGTGSPIAEAMSERVLTGLALRLNPVDAVLVGINLDGGLSMDETNPENLEAVGELSVMPAFGTRIGAASRVRLDLVGAIGWTALLGGRSGNLASVNLEASLTWVMFEVFGHPFHLGGWVRIESHAGLEDGSSYRSPVAGGIVFGADLREPENDPEP